MTAPQPTLHELTEELSSSQVEAMRRRAQLDLYFLGKGVLGYTQLHPDTHMALCAFLAHETADRRIVLMARGFLKSTLGTMVDSIRLSLIDPNWRILIANENYEQACAFIKEIKGHWETENLLTALFPELVPERFAGTGADWSADSASINRTRRPKESTYMALGVGGSRVGMHFDTIKGDDLAGNLAKESSTMMQRVCRWTDDLPGLLETPGHVLDLYGTRKGLDDVYAYNMAKWGDRAKVFLREPLDASGETIFPKMTTHMLRQIETESPEVWAADYMNNPVGRGGIDWGIAFLSYFTLDWDLQKVSLVEPLSRTPRSWRISELDIVISCDPNSGKRLAPDKAAIIVHGVTPTFEVLVLEAWSGRDSPDELVRRLHRMCKKWQPRQVGIEEAGQQNTLFYFDKLCVDSEEYFSSVGLKPGNKLSKEERIRKRLDPLLKQRRLFLQVQHSNLKRQISFHPQLGARDFDEIDCLATGPELYRAGITQEDLDAENEAVSKLLAWRGSTGYGMSCVDTTPFPKSEEAIDEDERVFVLQR